jgi:hypothetical protein
MSETIAITGVWLRRRGGENGPATAEVLVEIDGVWRKAIVEDLDSNFSHIAEGAGAHSWPEDDL